MNTHPSKIRTGGPTRFDVSDEVRTDSDRVLGRRPPAAVVSIPYDHNADSLNFTCPARFDVSDEVTTAIDRVQGRRPPEPVVSIPSDAASWEVDSTCPASFYISDEVVPPQVTGHFTRAIPDYEVSLYDEGSMDLHPSQIMVGCPALFGVSGDETSPTDYELRRVSTALNNHSTTSDLEVECDASGEVLLHRVPPQVREKKKHIYEPSVLSLGPYHHRKLLDEYKGFKTKVIPVILCSGGNGLPDLWDEIGTLVNEKLGEIRSFYREGGEYSDAALATMMVRDACLVVYNMERVAHNPEIVCHATRTIGALGVTLMANDFSKLENQIPWWIIKALITLKYGDANGEALIRKFLSYANFWEYDKLESDQEKDKLERLLWESERPPPHLLEARRRVFLKEEEKKTSEKSPTTELTQLLSSPFRSATELRAKGIHFTQSSDFLNDITFVSHSLHGVLRLPVLRVDSETTTFFSNVIVLEMSPGNMSADFPVTSYINFMKTLIERPEDVKLLQKKGIIISYLMDNEQVVRMFNEIDTHDVNNFGIFNDVKMEINRHCNNRGKTWMAELFDTYFRSPWTAIALFAAIFLLCLTFLQTYFTMNPVN